jgi:hypothetical protein
VTFSVHVPAAGALSLRLRAHLPAIGGKAAREVLLGSASVWCSKAVDRVLTLKVASKFAAVAKSLRALPVTAELRFTDVNGAPFQSDVDLTVRR